MNITPEQIDLWRTMPSENQHLEFKEAKNQFDSRKLYRYCVALANEEGGFLVLGIADKPPRPVVGSNAFLNTVATASKIFTAVGFRVEVIEVNHPDGRVVVLQIPSRPKGTAYHYDGAYLMRSGEELIPMSEDQLRKIFAEGQPSWLEQVALQGLSAQDVVQFLDTQSFFELLNQPYPTEQSGVLERLLAERLVQQSDTGYAILNIGALLLAKSLHTFEGIGRKAARVVVYSGESKMDTLSDLTGGKGYAVGFRGLVQYVMGRLPQNEVIEDAIRKEVKLVPEVVIRELLANALIHQDFELTGTSPMVEVYADRVEISNPGEPIVPVDRFIDGYQSRNERLADLMRRFGICEEKSSGIDRVIEAAEFLQLPAPDFLVEHQRTVAVIYGAKDFKLMDRSDRVRACYQHCVLQWVKRVFDLVIDFGTSQSPKSTRPLTTYWCPSRPGHQALRNNFASSLLLRTWLPYDWTPRSEAYFVFPLAQGTPGKQCGLAATGDYQPSLRSPWLAAVEKKDDQPNPARTFWPFRAQWKQDFTDYLDCRGTGDH